MELMQAHREWSRRPAEERFTSLPALHAKLAQLRNNSRELVVANRSFEAVPLDGEQLVIEMTTANGREPVQVDTTHWSFGQLSGLASAPAGYIRTLPAPIAAMNLNYGLKVRREIEEVGTLLTRNDDGSVYIRAATGPKYGRIWNAEMVAAIMEIFGDGINGKFRIPGEWGQQVAITQDNTTLYGSDKDVFVFLCDEVNRIENPDRRDGKSGTLARGWFGRNSEVGDGMLELDSFLFDYVCGNRIVWGASGMQRIRIRHTASAPYKWREELIPALKRYENGSAVGIEDALRDAKAARLGDAVDEFLSKHFGTQKVGSKLGEKIKAAHIADEGRPIETAWDVITGATAYARSLPFQDDRLTVERAAGDIFNMFAPAPRKREVITLN
jgi:hypothetical protein